MAYQVKLVMKPKSEIIKRLNLEEKGKVQSFFTETCKKYMDPYVPYREGPLADDAYIEDKNKIVYDQLYAKYQYKGVRDDGTRRIHKRTRTIHPRASSYWDKKMWVVHKHQIEKIMEKAIERFAKE